MKLINVIDCMRKIWLKIIWFLLGLCPECGHTTADLGYGEFCTNKNCDWMR